MTTIIILGCVITYSIIKFCIKFMREWKEYKTKGFFPVEPVEPVELPYSSSGNIEVRSYCSSDETISTYSFSNNEKGMLEAEVKFVEEVKARLNLGSQESDISDALQKHCYCNVKGTVALLTPEKPKTLAEKMPKIIIIVAVVMFLYLCAVLFFNS